MTVISTAAAASKRGTTVGMKITTILSGWCREIVKRKRISFIILVLIATFVKKSPTTPTTTTTFSAATSTIGGGVGGDGSSRTSHAAVTTGRKSNNKYMNNKKITIPKMVLYVRMSGTLRKHRQRFYCTLLRSTLLFWNPLTLNGSNKLVVVLDDEVGTDHEFGTELLSQLYNGNDNTGSDAKNSIIQRHNWDIQIIYEKLPSDKSLLHQTGQGARPYGYRRQMYSSFLTDLHVAVDEDTGNGVDADDSIDDTLIVFMDNDAMFVSPVTLSSILDIQTDNSNTNTYEYKPRVFGTDCTYQMEHIQKWYTSTQHILGEEYPMIADFMSYFPVYIYASTIRNCRHYLMKRFGSTSNLESDNKNLTLMLQQFEQVYRHVNPKEQNFSPICVLLTYAWYFERYRYSWSLEICDHSNHHKNEHHQSSSSSYSSSLQALKKRNSKLMDVKHHITTNDVVLDHEAGLPVPQVAFHKPYSPRLTYLAHVSYCFATQQYIMNNTLGLSRQQQLPSDCLSSKNDMIKYKLSELYPLFRSDLQKYDAPARDYYQPKRCSPIAASQLQIANGSNKSTAEDLCIERLQQHFEEYANELLLYNHRDNDGKIAKSSSYRKTYVQQQLRQNILALHEYWDSTIQHVNYMAQSSPSNITCGAILK